MSLSGIIPADVSTSSAIAICAIAFVSPPRADSPASVRRSFSCRSQAAWPPRASSPRCSFSSFVAAAPLLPNAWTKADRKATGIIAVGALLGVPVGTYLLSRLDPVTTRRIISFFVFALLILLLSGWRYRGKDHIALSSASALSPASVRVWRRLGGRRSSATGWDVRSLRSSRAPTSCFSSVRPISFRS